MSEQVPIIKDVFGKTSYTNIIDRNFRQFLPARTNVTASIVSLEEFFALYESLFYEIPKEGEQSHTYIATTSAKYAGLVIVDSGDIDLLQQEITALKEQLLLANETIAAIK